MAGRARFRVIVFGARALVVVLDPKETARNTCPTEISSSTWLRLTHVVLATVLPTVVELRAVTCFVTQKFAREGIKRFPRPPLPVVVEVESPLNIIPVSKSHNEVWVKFWRTYNFRSFAQWMNHTVKSYTRSYEFIAAVDIIYHQAL